MDIAHGCRLKALSIIELLSFWLLCLNWPYSRNARTVSLDHTGATEHTPYKSHSSNRRWKAESAGYLAVRNRAAYDLQDHAAKDGMPAGRSVVEGGTIPYQSWAAAKKLENFANRKTADPLSKCYMPGVPRIMYMDFPFQIFQTADHIAITFEWSQVFRLIYTNGKAPLHPGIESWMGDSRGRWEGDTLVVNVSDMNDRTWFDMAGDFHSETMHLIERYSMLDADTIEYEVTVEDPKVFTGPWKISMPLYRRAEKNATLLEYKCVEFAEELLYGPLRKKSSN